MVVNVLEPSQAIRSGMAADVSFSFTQSTDAAVTTPRLMVPAKAVGEDANGRFVFLLEQQGQSHVARKQTITIGALTADGFEVTSGLSDGQLIATAGLQTLLDGQTVKLKAGQ